MSMDIDEIMDMYHGYPGDSNTHVANATSPKWINRFMALAELISTWSLDPSTKVGAVLVTADCKVIGIGYNGLFSGMNDGLLNTTEGGHCDVHGGDLREFKLAHTVHAEINAFANKTVLKTDKELYLFVTKPICSECAKHAVLNKVSGIYCKSADADFSDRWKNDVAVSVLKNMNINYTEIK